MLDTEILGQKILNVWLLQVLNERSEEMFYVVAEECAHGKLAVVQRII